MEQTAVGSTSATGGAAAVKEIDILWLTAGLGCDGETIAMTGATQPSIEQLVMGALPWIPKVNLHNPFLALANCLSYTPSTSCHFKSCTRVYRPDISC